MGKQGLSSLFKKLMQPTEVIQLVGKGHMEVVIFLVKIESPLLVEMPKRC